MEPTNGIFDRSGSCETSHSRSSSSALAIQGHQHHQAILRRMEEFPDIEFVKKKKKKKVKPFLGFHFGHFAVFIISFSAEWSRLTASLTDLDLVKLATVDLPALLLQSKATSTTKQYFTEWKKWELWAASKSGVQVFPVIPFHLSLYIAHLVQLGLSLP